MPANGTNGTARRPTNLVRQLEKLWASIDVLLAGGVGDGGAPGPPGPKGDKGDKGDSGNDGQDGAPGADGQSGGPGPKGDTGDRGPIGLTGNDGNDGLPGADGADGPSAYQVALANGFVGNVVQWLASLVGAKGDKGDVGNTGATGEPGTPGQNGNDGNDGSDGTSAYVAAVANGFVGTEAQWLLSLKGAQGEAGQTGGSGPAGADGKTVLSGSGAPNVGVGVNGDFYIRTDANAIYGPKASGAWGSPTSLIGPQGQQGNPGADGVRTASTAFGYSTGAGGTVTQATNKSTAVTLNKLTGEITMSAGALAAGAIATFVLNNSQVAAGDMLVVSHHSGGTIGPYLINGRVTGAGTCSIAVRNTSAASLNEAPVIKFAVIKVVTA